MDRKLPESAEIQRLIQLGAAARSCLACEANALRQRLDLPARLRSSLLQHPLAWCFSSLASGLAATWLLRRKQPPIEKKRRSLPATLLALGWTAASPVAKIWLGNQVKRWVAQYTFAPPENLRSSRSAPPSHSI
jgi:hypothetical protein